MIPCIASCFGAFVTGKAGADNIGIIPLVGIDSATTNYFPAGGNLSWSVFNGSKLQTQTSSSRNPLTVEIQGVGSW